MDKEGLPPFAAATAASAGEITDASLSSQRKRSDSQESKPFGAEEMATSAITSSLPENGRGNPFGYLINSQQQLDPRLGNPAAYHYNQAVAGAFNRGMIPPSAMGYQYWPVAPQPLLPVAPPLILPPRMPGIAATTNPGAYISGYTAQSMTSYSQQGTLHGGQPYGSLLSQTLYTPQYASVPSARHRSSPPLFGAPPSKQNRTEDDSVVDGEVPDANRAVAYSSSSLGVHSATSVPLVTPNLIDNSLSSRRVSSSTSSLQTAQSNGFLATDPTPNVYKRRTTEGSTGGSSTGTSGTGTFTSSAATENAPKRRRRKSKKSPRPSSATGSDGERSADEKEFNGENRLQITFENFGTCKSPYPRVGKKGEIPDGLTGKFTMYSERWAFQIKYAGLQRCKDGKERMTISWGIKNTSWDDFHVVTEDAEDAFRRETRGFTLCNRVFREAMQRRAQDYERLVMEEKANPIPNLLQVTNCETRAAFLRPEKVSEGPLLFGLRHKVVQDHLSRKNQT
jgi:hypothetical protein